MNELTTVVLSIFGRGVGVAGEELLMDFLHARAGLDPEFLGHALTKSVEDAQSFEAAACAQQRKHEEFVEALLKRIFCYQYLQLSY